jgi:hypothetical protein
MDMPMPQANAPDQAPPADDIQKESGGYTICIACQPDGSFEVYKEDAQDEATEPVGGMAGAPMAGASAEAGQPERERVDSLEEALKQVIRIHRQNPMDQSYSAQVSAGFQGEHQTPY